MPHNERLTKDRQAQVALPTTDDLVSRWRTRAELLRRHGAAEAAATATTLADELEATLRDAASRVLTLEAASRESGYSRDHISRLIRSGVVPNAGRKHAPAVRRIDLPRKAGTLPSRHPVGISKAQIAQSVVDSIRGHGDD